MIDYVYKCFPKKVLFKILSAFLSMYLLLYYFILNHSILLPRKSFDIA